MLHLVGQNQRRGSEVVVVVLGNVDAALPASDMVGAVDVLDGDIDLVQARTQRQRLPVDGDVVLGAAKQFAGHLNEDRILKGLDGAVVEVGDASEDVDRAGGYAVLVAEGDVAAANPQGQRSAPRGVGDLEVIGADAEE